MTRIPPLFLGIAAIAVLTVLMSTVFVVPQTRQAMVLQFGDPLRVIDAPGLHLKLPVLQNVVYFDRRLLDIDPQPQQVILADKKRLEVDAYGRYRITDALQFFRTLNNEAIASGRLASVINSSVRRVLGNASLDQLLSGERERIMADIQREVQEAAKRFGVDVIEVRLRRADLPDRTSESVFSLMRSERDREARELRAEGDEVSKQIRAQADAQRRTILSKAERDAQIIKGEAEAKAVLTYGEAFAQDQQFFAFYRSLEAYRSALGSGETTFMLSPENDFFRYFRDWRAVKLNPGAATRP